MAEGRKSLASDEPPAAEHAVVELQDVGVDLKSAREAPANRSSSSFMPKPKVPMHLAFNEHRWARELVREVAEVRAQAREPSPERGNSSVPEQHVARGRSRGRSRSGERRRRRRRGGSRDA